MSKKKTTLVVAFVVMGIVVLGLAAAVYAKYIASLTTNSGTATVAKWAFKEENENSTLTCPLEKTYDASTLVDGKIAPGTKGTCTFALANTRSEVGVNYTITLTSLSGPQNLVFKNGGASIVQGGTITGTLAPGASAETITIDWEWPYYTNDADDEEDTIDGRTAAGEASTGTDTMEVTFDISGVQVQPE